MREMSDYVGKPIRSLQTMLRVLSKTREDQPSVVPDGVYGDDTVRAVSAFQWKEGLPVNGVADSTTQKRVADAYTKEAPLVLPASPLEIIWQPNYKIHQGEKNLHLYLIQAMLAALADRFPDMPRPDVTGVHDERSVAAVKWLQRKCGRPATGTIDQNDWHNLTRLYRMTAGDGKKIYGTSANKQS